MPFEQLIIFSTNLEPEDLVDEAFLRRIPYKIEIGDPSEAEFHRLFEFCCPSLGCEYRRDAVDYLLATHYRPRAAAAAALPSARPARPDPQLLRLQQPADGDAAGALRPRRQELLHGRHRRSE